MMRVGSGLSGIDLLSRNALTRATDMLAQTSLRLATLQRVNRGSDDPAGVIAIGTLRSELEALEQASDNADRVASVVRMVDSGLDQASALIRSIRGSTVAAASGTASPEEVAAHQIEIDAALDALDRIGYTTDTLNADVTLDEGSTGQTDPTEVTGDTLTFLFAPDPNHTVTLALPRVDSHALGGASGRLADLRTGGSASLESANLNRAFAILEDAEGDVLAARARLGRSSATPSTPIARCSTARSRTSADRSAGSPTPTWPSSRPISSRA